MMVCYVCYERFIWHCNVCDAGCRQGVRTLLGVGDIVCFLWRIYHIVCLPCRVYDIVCFLCRAYNATKFLLLEGKLTDLSSSTANGRPAETSFLWSVEQVLLDFQLSLYRIDSQEFTSTPLLVYTTPVISGDRANISLFIRVSLPSSNTTNNIIYNSSAWWVAGAHNNSTFCWA